jgi:hypothetical protein
MERVSQRAAKGWRLALWVGHRQGVVKSAANRSGNILLFALIAMKNWNALKKGLLAIALN